LDANCARGQRKQSRTFENSPYGWKLMPAWFTAMGSKKKAHVCMEATRRHSLGVALVLHDAGHIVSKAILALDRQHGIYRLGHGDLAVAECRGRWLSCGAAAELAAHPRNTS
jgi:hypothetical protein